MSRKKVVLQAKLEDEQCDIMPQTLANNVLMLDETTVEDTILNLKNKIPIVIIVIDENNNFYFAGTQINIGSLSTLTESIIGYMSESNNIGSNVTSQMLYSIVIEDFSDHNRIDGFSNRAIIERFTRGSTVTNSERCTIGNFTHGNRIIGAVRSKIGDFAGQNTVQSGSECAIIGDDCQGCYIRGRFVMIGSRNQEVYIGQNANAYDIESVETGNFCLGVIVDEYAQNVIIKSKVLFTEVINSRNIVICDSTEINTIVNCLAVNINSFATHNEIRGSQNVDVGLNAYSNRIYNSGVVKLDISSGDNIVENGCARVYLGMSSRGNGIRNSTNIYIGPYCANNNIQNLCRNVKLHANNSNNTIQTRAENVEFKFDCNNNYVQNCIRINFNSECASNNITFSNDISFGFGNFMNTIVGSRNIKLFSQCYLNTINNSSNITIMNDCYNNNVSGTDEGRAQNINFETGITGVNTGNYPQLDYIFLGNFTKTIYKRPNGTTWLRYMDDNGEWAQHQLLDSNNQAV